MNADRHLLVDFENVQAIAPAAIPDGMRVTVFVGSTQKSLPFDLVSSLQGLGERLKWQKVEGGGNNALDFQLAFHLGCCLTRHPKAEYVILSKDRGFDPLVRHLEAKGFRCCRINGLDELAPKPAVPKPAAPADAHYQRVLEILAKSGKARPRTRATLVQHVSAMFQRKLTASEVEQIVTRLFKEGKAAEANKCVSYSLGPVPSADGAW